LRPAIKQNVLNYVSFIFRAWFFIDDMRSETLSEIFGFLNEFRNKSGTTNDQFCSKNKNYYEVIPVNK